MSTGANHVSSYQELKDRQAHAAVAISGAHHSSWNGHQFVVDPREEYSGIARWEGSIGYKDDRVNEPLREMFEYAGHYNQPPETLRSYRNALKTTLHENSHLLTQEGAHYRDGKNAYQTKAGKALEEGVTEAWSHRHLNEYIDELGLERIAPGISDAEGSEPVYRPFVPAAQSFANAIGRRTGIDGDKVLRQLNVQTVDNKFDHAATLLYDKSPLAQLETRSQRDASIKRIAEAMRPPFERLDALPKDDMLRRQSAVAGAQAERLGSAEVSKLIGERTSPGRQAERGSAARQTGFAQSQQAGSAVDAMRVGLGGTTPLSGATRLDASRFGSRRATTPAAGLARRSPERGE
ncbi:MAG TPA: hypothetical protein VGJ44_17630 [Kribbellaceae bacterium]